MTLSPITINSSSQSAQSQLIKVKGAEQSAPPPEASQAKQPTMPAYTKTDARSGASPAMYG